MIETPVTHFFVYSRSSPYSMQLLEHLNRYIGTAIVAMDGDDESFQARKRVCGFHIAAPAIISIDNASKRRMVYMQEELELWLTEFGHYQSAMMQAKQDRLNRDRAAQRPISTTQTEGFQKRPRINIKDAAAAAEKERSETLRMANMHAAGPQSHRY